MMIIKIKYPMRERYIKLCICGIPFLKIETNFFHQD
ncbi:unnamed protein product [Paramecium octaurelia]|uniref:Uncharacterized protein n=1 Tax=Paramecium octaurelia TaxID=43137 RepID=A0A8S1WRF0_PAROT|nr:unnamed protein product [Paramecium octaurelia]